MRSEIVVGRPLTCMEPLGTPRDSALHFVEAPPATLHSHREHAPSGNAKKEYNIQSDPRPISAAVEIS